MSPFAKLLWPLFTPLHQLTTQCRHHIRHCVDTQRRHSAMWYLEAEFRLADELILSANDLSLWTADGADICIDDMNIHAGDYVVAHARGR